MEEACAEITKPQIILGYRGELRTRPTLGRPRRASGGHSALCNWEHGSMQSSVNECVMLCPAKCRIRRSVSCIHCEFSACTRKPSQADVLVQAVLEARMDDEVTAAVAANNIVAERAGDADEAAPRKFFAELGKRLEPLLDKARARLRVRMNPTMSWLAAGSVYAAAKCFRRTAPNDKGLVSPLAGMLAGCIC